MVPLIIRRLLQLPLVLAVVMTMTFFMCLAIPGDPVQGNKEMTPETRRAKRAAFQLDEPAWVQFGIYLRHLCPINFGDWKPADPDPESGDFWYRDLKFSDGTEHRFWFTSPPTPRYRWELRSWNDDWWKGSSLRQSIVHRPLGVWDILVGALPVSILLGVFSMTIALALGTAAGIVAAVGRNSWPDFASLAVSLLGISLPSFVTAVVLLIVFSVTLSWFPVGGWGTPQHLVLPAIALALPYAAYITRLTRAGMLDCLNQDYVRTARAKGLSPSAVVINHAFRNAFLPVLSFLGPGTAGILTGSFVVENVFTVPGIGNHFVSAVVSRDYFLILGTVLVYSTLLVIFNLITDVLYGFLDPRIRVE